MPSPSGPQLKVLVGNDGTEVIAPGQSAGNTGEGTFHLDRCVVSGDTGSGRTQATRAPADPVTAAGARPARASAMARLAVRPPGDGGGRTAVWWPWLLVAAAVGWNLASLRALTVGVAYLNDSSLHEQMVRFATAQLRAGHLPLTSWFPFLGEGSPQFLHYQSLPAIVTGAVGLLTGPDVAFRWSLYLLLSLWPISVYLSARAFGAARPAAAASAAMAPFLVSATGVGYEQHAYLWTGFGVWTQLWATWTLPLAWGFSWRAIRDGRGYLTAVLLTALTVALHFETGYLALSVLLVWPLVAGRPLFARLRRAAILLGGSLLAAAWVIVPLLQQRGWAAVNEPLQGTGLVNGYGARQVLDWLVSGQLLDHGRLPVVTVFAALGFGLAWLAWSSDADARALLVALAVCLLLAFGRTTFGSLVDLIPGSADLFFRRFMMGVQLAALLLAGRGAAWLAARCVRLLKARVARWPPGLSPAAVLVAAIAVLAPAWLQLGAYDRHDSRRDRCPAPRRRHPGRRARSPDRGNRARRRRPHVRGDADELGPGVHRRRRPGLQVPREPRRRRGRLHAAHRLADDRTRVLLR